MRNRIAQIALYMILGLILLFVIGIGFYFISNLNKEKIKTSSGGIHQVSLEFSPINNFIYECVKKASIESAYRLGVQGGYYILPKDILNANYTKPPYYYFQGQNLMPTKERIEDELSKSVNEYFNKCMNLSFFEEQGFKFSFKSIKIKSSILDEKTIINVDFPLTIAKDNIRQEISQFSYELPFRIGHIYSISKELVEKILKEPYYTDLTYLLGQDLDISVIHFDECNDIYVILDNYTDNPKNDYLFLFAVKIDDKDCKFKINETVEEKLNKSFVENYPPVLDSIPYLIAYVNQTFTYNVTASDLDKDKLFFLDDTDLFHIHPLLGTIEFTPKTGQEGLYEINITVVDINGGYDTKWFYLEIK